ERLRLDGGREHRDGRGVRRLPGRGVGGRAVLGGGRGTEAACRGGLRRRRLLRAVRHLVQAVVRECGERAVAGGEGHDRHGRGAAGGGRRRGGQPDEEEGRGEGSRERSSDRWQGGFSESGVRVLGTRIYRHLSPYLQIGRAHV